MARAREKARIAKRRKELQNATRRLKRANAVRLSGNSTERDVVLKRRLKAMEDANRSRGLLATALRAPARNAIKDLDTRPGRYKKPKEARFEFEVNAKEAERDIGKLPRPSLTGAQGKALRMIQQARKDGRAIEDVWEEIRDETGLTGHDIFTTYHYSSTEKAA